MRVSARYPEASSGLVPWAHKSNNHITAQSSKMWVKEKKEEKKKMQGDKKEWEKGASGCHSDLNLRLP